MTMASHDASGSAGFSRPEYLSDNKLDEILNEAEVCKEFLGDLFEIQKSIIATRIREAGIVVVLSLIFVVLGVAFLFMTVAVLLFGISFMIAELAGFPLWGGLLVTSTFILAGLACTIYYSVYRMRKKSLENKRRKFSNNSTADGVTAGGHA